MPRAIPNPQDFLNYDKVETGKLTLELGLVKMFDLIEKTVTEFKLPAAKKKLNLTVNTPLSRKAAAHKDKECIVIGDVIRLTQVLRNLISNAVKFTPEDGTIDVQATWLPPCTSKEIALSTIKHTQFELNSSKYKQQELSVLLKGTLQLTVTDTGAGMTQEQVDKVFSQGTQFNVNALQAGNGSGLGTYIAKGIVKQHGGSLTATSKGINKGTTFTVSLPLYDIPNEIINPPKTKRSFSSTALNMSSHAESIMLSDCGEDDDDDNDYCGTLNILVVDDAKMNLKLLMKLLEKEGHVVDGAEDGLISVEKVKKAMEANASYDVILMDYQMPNMDGPTAARTIRQLGCSAFIVGVTGNIMPEDVLHFKNHGANAVLPKPIKIPDLKELWIEYGVKGSRRRNGGSGGGGLGRGSFHQSSMANIAFDLESIRAVVVEGSNNSNNDDDEGDLENNKQGQKEQQKPKIMPLFSMISSPKKQESKSAVASNSTSRLSMTGELIVSSCSTSTEEIV